MDRPISRRRFLHGAVLGSLVAVAGCSGRTARSSETVGRPTDPSSPTDRATSEARPPSSSVPETPPEGATHRIRVESVSESPPLEELDAAVRVVEPFATPEHPPRVELRLTNVGDRRVELATAVFGTVYPVVSTGAPPGLLLGRGRGGDGGGNACWQATATATPVATASGIALSPGDTHSETLRVRGHPDNQDACLPPGSYRFVVDDPLRACADDEACHSVGVQIELSVSTVE